MATACPSAVRKRPVWSRGRCSRIPTLGALPDGSSEHCDLIVGEIALGPYTLREFELDRWVGPGSRGSSTVSCRAQLSTFTTLRILSGEPAIVRGWRWPSRVDCFCFLVVGRDGCDTCPSCPRPCDAYYSVRRQGLARVVSFWVRAIRALALSR